MNFLATLIPFAASLLVITANGKHHNPCGSHCSKEDAEKTVRALQIELQNLVKQCDYKGALELSLPNASFAAIDSYCENNTCCSQVGSLETWWSYYTCSDTLYYPVQPVSVDHRPNGTVIITQPEIQATYSLDWERLTFAYNNKYHWVPVDGEGNCNFRLSYISANSLNCPAYIPNAQSCSTVLCGGK